jgi:hypothetical protein
VGAEYVAEHHAGLAAARFPWFHLESPLEERFAAKRSAVSAAEWTPVRV